MEVLMTRYAGWFLGVKLPAGVVVFDCRQPDDQIYFRSPWGERLYSGEHAAFELGLRTGWEPNERNEIFPFSTQFYFDARKEWAQVELSKTISNMVNQFRHDLKEYEDAKTSPAAPGEGGGCYYKPMAIYVANYGAGIIADRRLIVVKAFKG